MKVHINCLAMKMIFVLLSLLFITAETGYASDEISAQTAGLSQIQQTENTKSEKR